MRRKTFAAEDIAERVLRDVSGKSAKDPLPEEKRITPGPYCQSCVVNIIQGKRTYHTEAEWKHLDEVGQWHYRRDRRLRAREARRI